MIPYEDSPHYVVKNSLLAVGELHRFNDSRGVAMSAIYIDDCEYEVCPRHMEKAMIKRWNARCEDETLFNDPVELTDEEKLDKWLDDRARDRGEL